MNLQTSNDLGIPDINQLKQADLVVFSQIITVDVAQILFCMYGVLFICFTCIMAVFLHCDTNYIGTYTHACFLSLIYVSE